MLPLPTTTFEPRRVEQRRANSLSLVRFDRNDYSVPTAYAHHELTVIGGIEQVRISSGPSSSRPIRGTGAAEHTTYDPRHYLALLERKPGAFDFARPLEHWELPVCFRLLRRRLEADLGPRGTREFIKVLRLMERATLDQLTGAVDAALAIGATSADAVALILYHRPSSRSGCSASTGTRTSSPSQIDPPDLTRYARPDRDRSMTMKPLETKSLVLLRHHLKALRLPTIGAEAEKVAAQGAADNADHLSYLLQLCELELLEREKRAAERRLKAARFPTIKTLESFDFTARPSRQQAARRRARPLRVHRQARERPPGRQPRHRQEPPRDRARRRSVRAAATRSASTAPPSSSPR